MSNLIGSTQAAFALTLSTALTEQVDIAWQTIDGTGKAGIDYEAASGTVSFAPGETAKQIQVLVYGQNSTTANGLTFHIKLTPPTNAVLTNTLIDCTIVVTDTNNVPVTSLVVAQGKRGLAGLPGMSAYDHAVQAGYTGTLQQWMSEIADASLAATRAETAQAAADTHADRAEAAATASLFAGKVYQTALSGVDAVSGVPNGAYYFVRSVADSSVIDEYQNVNGVPTATGKAYPSYGAVNTATDAATSAAVAAAMAGRVYATAAAGVDPVTGVAVGEYYHVRSATNTHYIDEYQNVAGVATATGKSYPSVVAVDLIDARLTSIEPTVADHETRLDTAEPKIAELLLGLPVYNAALTYPAGYIANKDSQIQQYDGATWTPLLNNTLTSTSTTQALTAAQGKALNDKILGVGQTWQDVTASRALATDYTNTTGRPIVVFARTGSSTLQTTQITVDGVIAAYFNATSGTSVSQGATAIVPNGSTYQVTAPNGDPTLLYWSELR